VRVDELIDAAADRPSSFDISGPGTRKISDVIENNKLQSPWTSFKGNETCIDIIDQVIRTEFTGAPLCLQQLRLNSRPLLSSNSEQVNTVLKIDPRENALGTHGVPSDNGVVVLNSR